MTMPVLTADPALNSRWRYSWARTRFDGQRSCLYLKPLPEVYVRLDQAAVDDRGAGNGRNGSLLIASQVGVVQVPFFEGVPMQQAVPNLLVGLVVVPDADQGSLAGVARDPGNDGSVP